MGRLDGVSKMVIKVPGVNEKKFFDNVVLVRYIDLNLGRTKIVKSLEQLDDSRWSGRELLKTEYIQRCL